MKKRIKMVNINWTEESEILGRWVATKKFS
jgi:hypothetical protein